MAHSFLVRQVLILGGQVSTGRRVRPLGHVEWGHSTLEEMVQMVGRGGGRLPGVETRRSVAGWPEPTGSASPHH